MFKKVLFITTILTMLTFSSCSSTPSQEFDTGDVLLRERFNQADAWENFVNDDFQVELEVVDGVYRIYTFGSGFIWGLNDAEHDNVVIEVTTEQISSDTDNAYGVICRADTSNNGDGYYFLISGDGFYTIRRGEGDDVSPIVDWDRSSAINQGRDSNTIRAVCIDEYLALYVNDRFVAEANDSLYSTGFAGFAASASDDNDAEINFDDLTIWEASLAR
jgi:hypothetical protein